MREESMTDTRPGAQAAGGSTGEHLHRETVVSQVMDRIKELIASGQYRPGDRLPTEQEMAAWFGVGRSSIREAMKVFQHLGVVKSMAAKGTFVCDRASISGEAVTWALLLGSEDLLDVFQLRETIETRCFSHLARALAAGDSRSRETVERLQQEVDLMSRAALENDAAAVAEADYRFHGMIIEAGENELFQEVYGTLQSFMRLEIAKSYERMSSYNDVGRDHQEIVDVLRSAPPEEAIRRHAEHFRRTRGLLGMNG